MHLPCGGPRGSTSRCIDYGRACIEDGRWLRARITRIRRPPRTACRIANSTEASGASGMEGGASALEALPEALLHAVLARLDFPDACRLARASRRLRAALRRMAWARLSAQRPRPEQLLAAARLLAAGGAGALAEGAALTLPWDAELDGPATAALAAACPGLRRLRACLELPGALGPLGRLPLEELRAGCREELPRLPGPELAALAAGPAGPALRALRLGAAAAPAGPALRALARLPALERIDSLLVLGPGPDPGEEDVAALGALAALRAAALRLELRPGGPRLARALASALRRLPALAALSLECLVPPRPRPRRAPGPPSPATARALAACPALRLAAVACAVRREGDLDALLQLAAAAAAAGAAGGLAGPGPLLCLDVQAAGEALAAAAQAVLSSALPPSARFNVRLLESPAP
eukprot:tig00020537_g10277.t1